MINLQGIGDFDETKPFDEQSHDVIEGIKQRIFEEEPQFNQYGQWLKRTCIVGSLEFKQEYFYKYPGNLSDWSVERIDITFKQV